ncbi:Chromosome-associated kinesin KIF4A [Tolypocladium ophioglossoides CBS 100239]|uniref:Chromosome-associated kinesin KIF4A n=1 Tax=Tolypocladium ophioglossoides (strain CBS 100239) TaxID=1163406 RepID=A0A0L0N0N6_TOLOC|nr:Chromosome-associated kinesin KIF4A [Tolypocladium ophioglossoides CBS 100239]
MATSPPASPIQAPQRPMSAIARPAPRSASRMSMSSKPGGGGGSRASDDDSRTAVRVAVRVRPPLNATDPGYDLIPQRFQRSMVQTTSNTSLAIDSPQGRKLFVFDRVFSPDVMQDGVWEYLADSVNAFTQGYNVSLLAYGQSGAGKSYTMGTSGPKEQQDPDLMGVIPRAAAALFENLDMSRGGNSGSNPNRMSNSMSQLRTPRGYGQQNILGDRNWSLKATYVEIYKEQLRDLLVSDSTPINERNNVAIREDTKGNILLTGLHQVEIHSVDDLMSALNFGSTIRQTDATAINAKSSRSHAVFSLNLVQRKSKLQTAQGAEKRFSVPLEAMTGQEVTVTTDSKLHFVDLAGSERLKNTGAQGERAKEGISINAGLASLGKVISQLSSRQSGSHVSYRDSKLTRLLQDSLGGNAITYMIACVTPAEFHLSETLNTVQHAQRARAIQSKPRIQQVEEGVKQAIIERLRAEVSFLRDQIRSAAGGSGSPRRGPAAPSDRSDRQNEREVELQNQLLDAQENYNALGHRHARLISEMAKAREHEENGLVGDAHADSATDRLNRSNSFAQAVEQVVLEYEKTIQSLEQSLSNTRATLSNTETSLLEKETKCAYAETINGQLQSRLQKLMDREASTENYLHDLEAKLDGHTSGEEKNATIIMELRKEIARVRENEASCEDYISTLEERLAEADQDGELMQREIDRLEQVIERQRSLGKLDALLYELDHVDNAKKPEHEGTNGIARGRGLADHSRSQSLVSRQSQLGEPILEDDEHFEDAEEHKRDVVQDDVGDGESQATERAEVDAEVDAQVDGEDAPQSPAQSRFVADKLESVTQELIDLRVEHEATVDDFHQLHAKYEEAQRALAELQDAVDEARHPARVRDSVMSVSSDVHTRPESFGSDAKSLDMKDEPRSSITRSLSSELSSAIDSPATADTSTLGAASDDETATAKPAVSAGDSTAQAWDGALTAELNRLRTLAGQREAAEKELASKYAELESKHSETLDIVEELKTEVSKARAVEATSPRQSTPVIRRKSSQNLMIIDRAHRSFASLRNIASENFEGRPEVMQNFELNLNAAMHELHSRSERIQELEADVASAKKEMETKMTIISGLTRERSSLKASPMDMSMVATLRDQLEKNEKQLFQMREANTNRELELTAELESLRKALEESSSAKKNSDDASRRTDEELRREHEDKMTKLQAELTGWEGKHKAVLDSMQATETELRGTVQRLEAQVATLNASLADSQTVAGVENDEAAKEADQKHQNLIGFLRSEIDEYKAIINSNSAKVAELETAHESAKSELEQMTKAHGEATKEVARHQDLVAKLEEQIAAHGAATKTHQESLEQLKSDHAKGLAEVKAHEQKGYEQQVEVLMSEHADSVQKLEAELSEARDELMKVATQVAFALGVEVSVEKLTEQIDSLVAVEKALAEEQKAAGEMRAQAAELTTINESIMRDLEAAKSSLADILAEEKGSSTVAGSVVQQLSVVKNRMSDLEIKNKKHSRLVEELEEQLQNNFDEAQMTNNRLSTLQTERNAQLEEATAARSKLQAELDSMREEYASLQAKYHDAAGSGEVKRSNSNSTIRKSASHGSLPSPPPAIPLPPLPSAATRSSSPTNGVPTSPTSGRPGSKENVNISQVTEDQEARIRTIEKHLFAERQLTQTLEEALTDLERQSKKVKADCDAWKKRAHELDGEVKELKDRPAPESQLDNRWSLQALEEERKKRQAAEAARRQLEERMNAINKGKKKKGSLNCF